jgi:hypothetical protein
LSRGGTAIRKLGYHDIVAKVSYKTASICNLD